MSGSAAGLTFVLSEQFALALPDDGARVLREAIGPTHAFVARAIHDGQTDGSIRANVPAEALALLFMGAFQIAALARRTGAVTATPHAVEALDVLFRPSLTLEKP